MKIERELRQITVVLLFTVFIVFPTGCAGAAKSRQIISLNGTWEIAEGVMESIPDGFSHQVPVPGLVDMAKPAFAEVGKKSELREAFWYRHTFHIEGPIPEVALLKIHKAKYGTRVFLNGRYIGDHMPCFTPAVFDVSDQIRGSGATNELLVRVGAFSDAVPDTIPSGWDGEKTLYIPGIYDSVELILSGTPHIVRVQTVPDVPGRAVRVIAEISNAGSACEMSVACKVREVTTGTVVASGRTSRIHIEPNQQKTLELSIPIENCRLWSPEDPFLYELEAATGADTVRVRFGVRSFRFDKKSGRAILNGKPYFMRGTNVCIYRFFEDPLRGELPWREEWVRKLHRKFKSMHWNSIRYCIGFPPEMWYVIADEEGLLIQDEFPLWYPGNFEGPSKWPAALKSDQLIKEYTDWIHERCNHPCVVIWDAQNESKTHETGEAIQAVRSLDLSDRPWDNGWRPPQGANDCFESHPYNFMHPNFRLADLASRQRVPYGNVFPNRDNHPIIINEYGWLWLNRNGTPTTLSKKVYQNLLGPDASTAQLRRTYARYLAVLTEFWRCHRKVAGVLHFCGLGYSRPGGATSDNFIDIETLEFEPNFEKYVRDAFSPVGLMIDEWAEELGGGAEREFGVVVINDLYKDRKGTVRFLITQGDRIVFEQSKTCVVSALGQERLCFKVVVPSQAGRYQLVAELLAEGAMPVRSLRDFEVLTDEERKDRYGLAFGKPVFASLSSTIDGVTYPAENAVDGKRSTRWSSKFSDPQWIAVDLGKVVEISRVKLLWGSAYGKAYRIQVSKDGKVWKNIFQMDTGDGGIDEIHFAPTTARWVRLMGNNRGMPYGYTYSLWEFQVFP